MALPKNNQSITYANYVIWDEDVMGEAFDGVFYMSPAPSLEHQEIVAAISAELVSYLRNKKCRSFIAPIDVWLFDKDGTPFEEVKNWVQPDLVIVCDDKKTKGNKRIYGAPDLIIEVISTSTLRTDKLIKFNQYQKSGVKEYWIVDPFTQTVEAYLLNGENFQKDGVYLRNDYIPIKLFTDFSINLDIIFPKRDEET